MKKVITICYLSFFVENKTFVNLRLVLLTSFINIFLLLSLIKLNNKIIDLKKKLALVQSSVYTMQIHTFESSKRFRLGFLKINGYSQT